MASTAITITIEPSGPVWSDQPRTELATVLRKLADQLDAGWYATFHQLPSVLVDSNGNTCGTVHVAHVEDSWAELLEQLPVIEADQVADLHVERNGLRVWLHRTTTADGDPFDSTVYVEAFQGTGWCEVGYFDGDEPDPTPVGLLGDALTATRAELEAQR